MSWPGPSWPSDRLPRQRSRAVAAAPVTADEAEQSDEDSAVRRRGRRGRGHGATAAATIGFLSADGEHSQSEQSKQSDKGEVERIRRRARGDDHRLELEMGQAKRRGLVRDGRAAYVRRRRCLEDSVDDTGAIKQVTTDSRRATVDGLNRRIFSNQRTNSSTSDRRTRKGSSSCSAHQRRNTCRSDRVWTRDRPL
jgi:hypothetical protein